MDDLVKQRLVGAVVLALIAVLLLPWLFGNPKDPRASIRSSFSGTPVPTASAGGADVVLIEQGDDESVPAAAQPTPRRLLSPPRPAAVSAAPTPPREAWLLQLASYSDRAAADDFRARLRGDGHVAYREQIDVSGKTYYRVRLKVEGSQREAEAVMREIESKYRLQAKMLPAR